MGIAPRAGQIAFAEADKNAWHARIGSLALQTFENFNDVILWL